jgi:hypothetical protein
MTKGRVVTPGTVSKILWHFTGGPVWDSERRKQSDLAKPSDQAYDNLKSILKSGELRLGSYKEVVRVRLAPFWKRDRKTGKKTLVNPGVTFVESSPVCCLADIPAPHLGYHARRYGKFALGFHRDAVVQAGFNPVFYTLHDAPTIRSIYRGFAALNKANVDAIGNGVDAALSALDDDYPSDAAFELYDIRSEANLIGKRISTARKSLSDFVAFVKTFERTEFNTIYCEREWRSIRPFNFDIEDIAMVVLPRKIGQNHYFRRFVERFPIGRNLPRGIPIVAWEDLVES